MKVSANDIAKDLTLNVTITGYRGWLIRLKVAILLIHLACYISGMNVKFIPMENIEGRAASIESRK